MSFQGARTVLDYNLDIYNFIYQSVRMYVDFNIYILLVKMHLFHARIQEYPRGGGRGRGIIVFAGGGLSSISLKYPGGSPWPPPSLVYGRSAHILEMMCNRNTFFVKAILGKYAFKRRLVVKCWRRTLYLGGSIVEGV